MIADSYCQGVSVSAKQSMNSLCGWYNEGKRAWPVLIKLDLPVWLYRRHEGTELFLPTRDHDKTFMAVAAFDINDSLQSQLVERIAAQAIDTFGWIGDNTAGAYCNDRFLQ